MAMMLMLMSMWMNMRTPTLMVPGMLHTSALATKLGTEDVVDYDDDGDDDGDDDDIDDPRYAHYVSASEKCACYETGDRRCC